MWHTTQSVFAVFHNEGVIFRDQLSQNQPSRDRFMPSSSTPVSSTTVSSTPVSSTVVSFTQCFLLLFAVVSHTLLKSQI